MPYDKDAEEARKAKWDADAAEAAAKKAAREEAEASSPAAVARREALAEKDTAAAQRAQIAALVPDFTKVDRGDLTVSGSEPVAGAAVAGHALEKAAELVRNAIVARTDLNNASVLVTGDANLAGSDAAYHSTDAGLDQLETWAQAVLSDTAKDAGVEREGEGFPPLAVAGALAGAVPGILSLLSAHRTVTTAKVTIDDLAAAAAVAGALSRPSTELKVFHDTVRLLPDRSALSGKVDALSDLRGQLIERKAVLQSRTPADGKVPQELADSIARVGAVAETIAELLTKLVTVPEGASRSLLASAMLREGLHDGTFKYVVLVKAQSAGGAQLVNDKPLWSKDKFSVLAAASITWMLIDVAQGNVLDAGVASGTAEGHGTIGDAFELEA
jgi:hypothetical protein